MFNLGLLLESTGILKLDTRHADIVLSNLNITANKPVKFAA